MKIANGGLLTVALLGSLVVSTAAVAHPVVVADDFEVQKQKLAATKGASFSSDRVLLSQSELDELQSMLTTFKEENNKLRLEAGEEWFWNAIKTVGRFVWRKLTSEERIYVSEESDLLKGKKNDVTIEQEFMQDQALKVEQFLDNVAQSNIAEDRDDNNKDFLSGYHEDKMVAVLTSTMYPSVPDDLVVAADEYLSSTKASKDPLSRFNLPLTKEETNKLLGMVETFEKENALLKTNEEFWGKIASWGVNLAVKWLRRDGDELGAEKPKRVEVELTEQQALLLEEYMDELGDKYIEENRAAVAPSNNNLRGSEEWLWIASTVVSVLGRIFRE